MPKTISLAAGLALTMAVAAPAASSAQTPAFSDVAGTTHESSILAIVDAGITAGYPDGTFQPAGGVTRGQLATFLTTALDLPPGDASEFPDVAGHTHEASIGALLTSGLTTGYPDGTFRPDETITRGQMATFLAAGFELAADDTVRFEDVRSTTHGAGIGAVAAAGVTGGFADGTFRPAETVTRGQMATFLARGLDLADRIEPPPALPDPPPPPPFPLAPSGTTFGNGTHSDVTEGTYRADASSGCYWERLSGFGGTFDEIIANDFTNAATIVTIASGDRGFESSGCATWQAVQDTYPDSPRSSFADGAHVVGEHIEPGTYRSGASEDCYYERLAGFSGEFDDIVANGLTDDAAIVTIDADDVGFKAERCGTWTRD